MAGATAHGAGLGQAQPEVTLIAIDPGAHPGFAVFKDGRLIGGGYEWNPGWLAYNERLVIEKPTIYPHSKARPNDIVTLAITAGRLAATVGAKEEQWYLPRTWKGSIPKTKRFEEYIIHKRVSAILDGEEEHTYAWMLAVCPTGHEHDIADAVGIGLYDLCRL